MKANALMKSNVDAMLRARGQTRKDLAKWCRRSESWISKIMKEDRREFPMKYFDRIADFFGITAYQLLQPGISHLTERREGRDRRCGHDRRLGHMVAPQSDLIGVSPKDAMLIERLNAMSFEDRQRFEHWMNVMPLQERLPIAKGRSGQRQIAAGQSEPIPRSGGRRQ